MRLLCAGSSKRVKPDYAKFVGDFVSPRRRQFIGSTPVWAADNDAFSGFNEDRYLNMVRRIAAANANPTFVTLPDVVCSHKKTLDLFHHWHRPLGHAGLRRAFVLQNGVPADFRHVPYDYIEALFIGGDDEFKLGPIARYHVEVANHMGKWVHMGRVNSVKRMRYARDIGCHSCDGSGMARFPNDILMPMVRALAADEYAEAHQLTLL